MDIGYDDSGTGDALLLVHGHPFDRTMWRPQAEYFRATHRVLVPDLRGYGKTPVRGEKTLLSQFAEDLVLLLDHLRIERCALGGLSMGGQIVLEFQRRFPERLTHLLLADTSALAETPEGRKNRTEMTERLLREGMAPYAAEVLRKMAAPGNADVDDHVLAMMRDAPPQGAAAALRGRAERPDYVETLRTVAVPTLVVVGSEDEFTPLADAELIHRTIPGAELVVIEGAAHLPNLERPAEFNAALARLLKA